MLEELQLRNYAQNTIRHYVRTVEDFARRFNCSPDRLGPRHVREYQAELFRKGKSSGTVTRHLAALRFFYVKTLRRAWSLADTPYPKKTHCLPTILSREEVAQLIHAARTPGQRILLMTLCATGARNSELTHLKVSDIDSHRMVVHIRGGKGRKDRDVMLSPRLLTALRTHWRFYHRKSSTWLFPATIARIGRSIRKPFGTRATKLPSAPASRNASIPTLCAIVSRRISMKPAPISAIQVLLGHADLKDTLIYVHLAIQRLNATASPLDSLSINDKSIGEK